MNKKIWFTALGTAATAVAYLKLLRPRLVNWGATPREAHRPMLGDDLVDNPTYTTTRAITIDTSPNNVWPWLVQMGEDRGGFYSYDFIDRLLGMKVHSAHRILPRYQDIDVGQRLDREGNMIVRAIEPDQALVLGPGNRMDDMDAAWALALYPHGEGRTRLISRTRAWFDLKSPRAVMLLTLLDPGHFVMEQKFLREIKAHAEGRSEKWPAESAPRLQ